MKPGELRQREQSLADFLGKNRRCTQCGRTFLQSEDGCPTCGHSARTVPYRQNLPPQPKR